jgi:hypothetical protein
MTLIYDLHVNMEWFGRMGTGAVWELAYDSIGAPCASHHFHEMLYDTIGKICIGMGWRIN